MLVNITLANLDSRRPLHQPEAIPAWPLLSFVLVHGQPQRPLKSAVDTIAVLGGSLSQLPLHRSRLSLGTQSLAAAVWALARNLMWRPALPGAALTRGSCMRSQIFKEKTPPDSRSVSVERGPRPNRMHLRLGGRPWITAILVSLHETTSPLRRSASLGIFVRLHDQQLHNGQQLSNGRNVFVTTSWPDPSMGLR